MALTATEALRILAIEKKLNELQVALNALVPKTQMKALLTIRQAEIDDLKERVEILEAAVLILQS